MRVELVAYFALATPVTSTASALFDFVRAAGGGGTIKIGVDGNGVRGLLAGADARIGDVLLEVPLAICVADCGGADATAEVPLPGAAPSWSSALPWNVQLAAAISAFSSEDSWQPFFSSWPRAPALPKDCEPDELALAGDREFAMRADEACFWLDEQYWALRAAEESAPEGGRPERQTSAADFGESMALVWSREA